MKKISITGLLLVLMIGIAGCGSSDQLAGDFGALTGNLEQLVSAAVNAGEFTADPATETTQEATQNTSNPQSIDNGNTQANIDNNKTAANNSGNKNGGAAANNKTSAPAKTTAKAATPTAAKTQAQPQQPQTTKATTKATTAKAITTKKQRSYYVCNGCGYKVLVADNGGASIRAHMKKQMLAGNMKCSAYHTDWL